VNLFERALAVVGVMPFAVTAGPSRPVMPNGSAARAKVGRRIFQAAARDRLVGSWSTADHTDNMALLSSLRSMRARSRQWFRDHEYGRKFAQLVKTNVVGPTGFALKVDARRIDGTPDKQDSDRVARAWRRFGKIGAHEVTGRMSETMFDLLAILMIARDGEFLLRFCTGPSFGPHQFQLQLLPAHLLNEDHNVDLNNGHRIRMGVEFDAFMKPVAYHLRLQAPRSDIDGSASQRYERVPAEQMLHLFVPEEIDQWRGKPWAHAALRDAWHLDKFDEAALVAANVGAAKMGFFRQSDAAEGQPTSGEEANDGTSDFVNHVEPGQFEVIPDGYELQEWDPQYPSDVYDKFVKAVARRMAMGLLVSAPSLTGDLTDVNFSSIRAGTLDEREMWKVLQGWYIAACKERVFEAWLTRAMLTDVDLKGLPYGKFDKFNSPVFSGRRWDWVDPNADVKAATGAVELGIKSRAQIIRDGGGDPDTVWAELEAEAAMGLTTQKQPAAPPPAA